MHEYLHGVYKNVLSKYDTITVGEMPAVVSGALIPSLMAGETDLENIQSDINEIIRTVGAKAEELNMIFIFDIVDIDNLPSSGTKFSLYDWKLKDLKRIVTKWQRAMIDHDGWNSVFVENHDQPRSVSRYTDDSDEFRDKGAKLLALMQTTLSGTLFVYQGEEFGMRNVPKSWDPEVDYKDIESINLWKKYKKMYPDDPEKLNECRTILQRKARDNARTPVQWSSGPNAGFSKEGVEPWMRVNDDYQTVNAEASKTASVPEQLSVWQFWERGLKDRKEHKDAFVYGDYEELDNANPDVFAYVRKAESGEKWLTLLNWSGKTVDWTVPGGHEVATWIASTYIEGKPEKDQKSVRLLPWEGILGRCK